MDEPAELLAIGDVHLGTVCAAASRETLPSGVDPGDLTPAAALGLAVDLAIERHVKAVLFAGDVVESSNARFEAMLPLEECVRRLTEAGIQVIAVAGNHDVEALPRLAALIDGFTLLGAGGTWEAVPVGDDGNLVAEIIGWSFGERYVRHSPVSQLKPSQFQASNLAPKIGLLHADLDAGGGHYAPVRHDELAGTNFAAWLLGHIHKPSIEQLSGTRPIGYLGSLVGLDPLETGPHGPWLVRLTGSSSLEMEHVPLAPLRWEHVTISVEGLDDIEDLPDTLLYEAERFVRDLAPAGRLPKALGLRVCLTGATPCYHEIRRWIEGKGWQNLGRVVEETAVFFNKVTEDMDLLHHLSELAAGDDPASLLARRLIDLQQGGESANRLVAEAREAFGSISDEPRWSPAKEHRDAADPMSDEALRDTLIRAGRVALRTMLTGHGKGRQT